MNLVVCQTHQRRKQRSFPAPSYVCTKEVVSDKRVTTQTALQTKLLLLYVCMLRAFTSSIIVVHIDRDHTSRTPAAYRTLINTYRGRAA